MTRRVSRVGQWLTVAVLAAAAGAVHANGSTHTVRRSSRTAEARQEQPPEFVRVCAKCHASDKVVQGRRYRSQWEEVLEKMVTVGAKGTDEEFEIVLEYLAREFGRVSINAAAAEEIAQVLHLEERAAHAMVQHRTKHGKFADFEALVAVPGVPIEALRKRRDAIVFQ